MDLKIESVLDKLQQRADAERELVAPKPTIKFDAQGNFALSNELMSMLTTHTVVGTDEVKRGSATVTKKKYGNNRLGFLVNGKDLIMMVTSSESLPSLGDTLRISLSGFTKDTARTNYAEILSEFFSKTELAESDWTLIAKEINASPVGSVCKLEILETVKTPSVKITEEESKAIDASTVLEEQEIEEEIITEFTPTIAEELEMIADGLLEVQEINVTTHTDIILE